MFKEDDIVTPVNTKIINNSFIHPGFPCEVRDISNNGNYVICAIETWKGNTLTISECLFQKEELRECTAEEQTREYLRRNHPAYLSWEEAEAAYYQGLVDRNNKVIGEEEMQHLIKNFDDAHTEWVKSWTALGGK